MSRFAAVALLALASCEVPPPAETHLPPHVTLYGVRMHTFRDAELVSFGRAAKLVFNRSTAHFSATEVALRFPSRSQSFPAPGASLAGVELRAPLVEGHLPSRLAEGSGGVSLRTSSGLWGQTERARFDGMAQRAQGELPMRLEGKSYLLTAHGFDLDFASERFRFTGGVKSLLGGAQ